jgi:hypothetical protein
MKKLLILVGLVLSAQLTLAAPPSWKELQAAVKANEFERVQGWIKQDGLESSTAANALIAAAMAADRALLDRFLGLGISINLTNYYGASALIKAADEGRTEMVRHLLQRGAKANAVGRCDDLDCKGHTALMGAACRQDVEMARILLEAGADPRMANNAATEMANQNGDLELYLLLTEFGGRQRAARITELETTIPLSTLGLTELLPRVVLTIPEARSKTRLAIIADDSNVLPGDLLTAQLSSKATFELVERQELDRVLSEQRLTRQFAADAANYARVAALLRADALLLIQGEKVADTRVVESRFVRVNPGLVLDTVYSSAPLADPPSWAERMSAHLTGLSAKVARQDAIALSLLGIRSSIKSSADRGLDRTIATLVSDRLAHQPQFILLERAAMERLTAEGAGPFWTGSYLVDGTIEPALDGSGAFALSVRFQPASGGEALTFNSFGRRAKPSEAIDDLLLKINSRLKQSPVPPRRDLTTEAQQYLEEAKWAVAAQRPQLAQSTTEAAWALGLHSVELARLRVSAAMFAVQHAANQSMRKQDTLGPGGWLDMALHGLTVWREMLDDELLRGKPDALHNWLEFGFEAIEGALAGIFQINTVAERAKQNARLEKFHEAIWDNLEEVRKRAALLPGAELLVNRASEKQAGLARMLFPRTADFVRNAQELVSRHFQKDDALTCARIRANLVGNWSIAVVPIQDGPNLHRTISLRLSRGDEASRQFAHQLRNSPAPEDRYLSALLALKRSAARGEATQADVERLCTSLFDLRDLLAEGGEIFQRYFGLFDELDNLEGMPFFAMTRHRSGNRMWERHTAEHSAFRRKLFLAIAAKATKGDPQFQRMLSQEDFTAEQQTEIMAAQARLGLVASVRTSTPRPSGAIVMRSEPAPHSPANPSANVPAAPSKDPAPPLQVRRLWHPFNLPLRIAPEFRAHWANLQWAERRLWFNGSTLTEGGQPDRHYVFCIDPETMRTETFAVPEPAATLEGRLLLTPKHLLLAMREYLAVFDRAKSRWNAYEEIKLAVGPTGFLIEPVVVGDSVYLVIAEAPGNAVISLNLNTRVTEILASTSRRPAVSPLDDPGIRLGSLTANEANEIIVTAGKVGHAWSPAKRSWHPVPSPPSRAAQQNRGALARVGNVRKVNDVVTLRLTRKDTQPIEIPLTFVVPPGTHLPQSRFGPQNIGPTYCNEFAAGLLLVPQSGSGFWVVPRQELDDHLHRRNGKPDGIESAANNKN